ncbi:hypothetical protein ACFLRZ_05615, partial [Bacteroidota bacterium]
MRKILLMLILGAISVPVFSQPWAGGEISWECLQNGRYRFIFKFHVHCGTVWPGQYKTLSSNSPAGNISLKFTSDEEITPSCNPSTSFIHYSCATAIWGNLNGEMKIYTYTSDQSYPNGVLLNGAPPSSGWVFKYYDCCRYPASNIVNANVTSLCYYAIMYPYNNQNANPCFDNSPTFSEKPVSVFSSGIPVTLNNAVTDRDNDSLVTSWSPIYDNYLNPITSYSSGYNYLHPFNTNSNYYSTLDPASGDVFIPNPQAGSYIVGIKASSYRNGQKIAEILRDFHYEVKTFGTNTAPVLAAPFYDSANGIPTFTDTVFAGEYVNIPVIVTDFNFLPNNTPTTVTIEADSIQFGTSYIIDTSGCPIPPCPTLSSVVPISGFFAAQTNILWQTNCNHLNVPDSSSNYHNKRYNFYIRYGDDFCPATATNIKAISIIVKDWPLLESPKIQCISVNNDGSIGLSWDTVQNEDNSFVRYVIYTSSNVNGPFIKLDSINNIGQLSYTDQVNNGQLAPVYYVIKTISGCNGNASGYDFDTLSTIFLQSTLLPSHDIELKWNHISDPLPAGSYNYYRIYRKYGSAGWTQINAIYSNHYIDTTAGIHDSIYYKVTVENISGCTSVSSVAFVSSNVILYDAGLIEIMEPDSAGSINNIKVAIKNSGINKIDTLHISYEIQGSSGATEIWTGQLESGDTLIYDFLFNPVFPSNPYKICAISQLTYD